MPCRSVGHLGPSGPVTAAVCGPGLARRRCVYCSSWSEVLCDYPLAGAAGKTCDRRMCRRCARHVAGKDLDYCRAHANLMDAAPGAGGRP